MKKRLLAVGFGLIIAIIPVQASEKIVVVNMGTLFRKVAQKSGVFMILENEFKNRASELQHMEGDLQSKIQRLHRDGPAMKDSDRINLEKDLILQRKKFSRKEQAFEEDQKRRADEERDKLIMRIQSAMKSVAIDKNIDLVIDANAIAFHSKEIKDITTDVLQKVR